MKKKNDNSSVGTYLKKRHERQRIRSENQKHDG